MANANKRKALEKAKQHPVHEMAERWKKTGRIAFHHPKSHTYSLNGGMERSYDDAHKEMSSFFNK